MLSAAQIKKYRVQLQELSFKPLPKDKDQNQAERELIAQWRDFAPDKAIGRQLCDSFSDEELLGMLRDAFERLGRAPAQSDIFCFYRTYIKHRFVTWTSALKAAGLSRALDSRISRLPAEEYERIEREEPSVRASLIRLSERRTELGYPPGRKEFPESEALKQRFGSWSAAISAAEGLDEWQRERRPENPLHAVPEEEALFRQLREVAGRLGRTPLKTEVREEMRCLLRLRCGSWDSVLERAGLPPLAGESLERAEWDSRQHRRAGTANLYLIADLEPEYKVLLKELATLAEALGRAPLKGEMDAEKRTKLQERCGSWRNALYQIGAEALTKREASQVKKRKRDWKKKESVRQKGM